MSTDPKKTMLELAQECISKAPVIILGSGASAAYGIPGMPQLKNHLLSVACPISAKSDEVARWAEFQTKLVTTDLETALDGVQLPETLTQLVVESTWDYLAPYDYDVFERAIIDHNLFPLTQLFLHLFNSTRRDVHVVTPNYDRIAEYAADAGKLAHYTGFHYGHIRARAITGRMRVHVGNTEARTVNIWKVHGSFDWFRDRDDIVVGLPVSRTRPANVFPVIVTPGIKKYQLTHDEPFHSIKSEADKALQNANAFLCIGYGFNDAHLQTTLVERCRGKDVPLILITKSISDTAKAFFNSGKCLKYLAIEDSLSGCRIYSKEFPGGEDLTGDSIWRLGEFLKLVIS